MNGEQRVPVSIGMKLVSLLLIVGGVLGVGLTFWLDINLISSGRAGLFSLTMAITGAFIVVFGWAAWTGRELWLGKRYALRMAQILFALQIPLLHVPGFAYEFYTGLIVSISVSGPRFTFGFNLGSAVNFYFSPEIQDFAFGVNIIAVLVLIYLLRQSRKLSAPMPQPLPAPMS